MADILVCNSLQYTRRLPGCDYVCDSISLDIGFRDRTGISLRPDNRACVCANDSAVLRRNAPYRSGSTGFGRPNDG